MDRFFFVQLPHGPWTIARRDDRGQWWFADDDSTPTGMEFFKAIGDMIPVPPDGNHLSIMW